MKLLKRLFGSDTSDKSESERPPKPEDEHKTTEHERTRYKATVEYRNGDVETFDCYGIYSRGEHIVSFNTDPYAKLSFDNEASYSYDRQTINYETLAREPILTEVGTDVFFLSYDETWEYRGGRQYRCSEKMWRPEASNVELEVVEGGAL